MNWTATMSDTTLGTLLFAAFVAFVCVVTWVAAKHGDRR